MTNMFADFESRINRGIKFLDAVRPNWVDSISLETFDLNSVYDCILGQLFSTGVSAGYHKLEAALDEYTMYELGFIGKPMDSFKYDPQHYDDCTDESCLHCEYGVVDSVDLMQDMWEYRIRQMLQV